MDLYRNSYGATKLCAEEFSRSYEQAYAEHKVPEYLQKMVDQYGFKRCQIVLASTIQLLDKDGRISTAMKDAASKIQIPEASMDSNHDRRMDFRITFHPVTVNAAFRDLLKMEQKQMAASQTQSSVLSKMNAKESNVPQKKPSILKKVQIASFSGR